MPDAAPIAEVHRGDFLESIHLGHAVIVDAGGQIVEAWGNPDQVILPRSSAKMLQALPLVESGAAKDLGPRELALACASHQGAKSHVTAVNAWLHALGLDDDAFRCGPEVSRDLAYRDEMIREGHSPCQVHNNCSGKHAGFLTLTRHLGAGPEYIEADHPVQRAVRDAFEDMTGEASPGFGVDGCSAPNFATTLSGFGRSMARFAALTEDDGVRGRAALRLRNAMMAHPDMVAGEGRACTALMRAAPGKLAVKTGAEGVFIAILPELRMGVAVKAADGATRASEAAIAALCVRLGVLEAADPVVQNLIAQPIRNRRDLLTGHVKAASDLLN